MNIQSIIDILHNILYNQGFMDTIELIITCEDCNIVKHYKGIRESDSDKLVEKFKAKHANCNPKFMSYFSISSIPLHPVSA